MRIMFNIKERPYRLLLFTAGALLAFVFPPFATLDFRDITMFNLPLGVVVWIIPLLLVSFWLLYLLTRKFLYSMTFTRIHILTTVSTTILIAMVLYGGINSSPSTVDRHELVGNAMQILVILFVCAQFTYLLNVLLGLFGRQKAQ